MKEELYMRRCFELAERAIGYTYPNPLVGAVIVHNGENDYYRLFDKELWLICKMQ